MAYYEYKRTRDAMPDNVMTTEYYRAAVCNCDGSCAKPCEYEGDCNYDGDMWTVTAEYITRLKNAAGAFYMDPTPENAVALKSAMDGETPALGRHERTPMPKPRLPENVT